LRILYLVTLAERGGAQVHVADLLRGFSGNYELALGTGTDGYLCDVARDLKIPVFRLRHLVHPMQPLRDACAVAELLRIMKIWRPDLIHGHTSKAGMIARAAGCLRGTPTVFTAHTWSFSACFSWQQQRISVMLERLAGGMNCRIIAVSEANRDLASRHRITRPDKLITVWNGIPDTTYRADPGTRQRPRIVMVGRFVSQKDQSLLIQALAGIDQEFQLDLVGDGPLRPQVEAEARRLGRCINFLGERSDVAEILATAQMFVLATKWEGLPLSILEGMRAGLPVIASDVGGVAEAVTDGENGFLTPVGDCRRMHMRLEQLLRDPDLRVRMGMQGRRRYEDDFTLQKMLGRTAAVYDSMLAGPTVGIPAIWGNSNESVA
jgi:glycosyltransferase involved in cell wall biosynthesis